MLEYSSLLLFFHFSAQDPCCRAGLETAVANRDAHSCPFITGEVEQCLGTEELCCRCCGDGYLIGDLLGKAACEVQAGAFGDCGVLFTDCCLDRFSTFTGITYAVFTSIL